MANATMNTEEKTPDPPKTETPRPPPIDELPGVLLSVATGLLILLVLAPNPGPIDLLALVLGITAALFSFLGNRNRKRAILWNQIFIGITVIEASIPFFRIHTSYPIITIVAMLWRGGMSCILALWAFKLQSKI